MARTTGAIRHTHQYYRTERGVWRCMRDGCTHFVPKNMEPAPLGNKSICWSCEQEFIMTRGSMQNEQPRCDSCTVSWEMAGAASRAVMASMPEPEDPLVRMLRQARERATPKKPEPDQIEVIEPEE